MTSLLGPWYRKHLCRSFSCTKLLVLFRHLFTLIHTHIYSKILNFLSVSCHGGYYRDITQGFTLALLTLCFLVLPNLTHFNYIMIILQLKMNNFVMILSLCNRDRDQEPPSAGRMTPRLVYVWNVYCNLASLDFMGRSRPTFSYPDTDSVN